MCYVYHKLGFGPHLKSVYGALVQGLKIIVQLKYKKYFLTNYTFWEINGVLEA